MRLPATHNRCHIVWGEFWRAWRVRWASCVAAEGTSAHQWPLPCHVMSAPSGNASRVSTEPSTGVAPSYLLWVWTSCEVERHGGVPRFGALWAALWAAPCVPRARDAGQDGAVPSHRLPITRALTPVRQPNLGGVGLAGYMSLMLETIRAKYAAPGDICLAVLKTSFRRHSVANGVPTVFVSACCMSEQSKLRRWHGGRALRPRTGQCNPLTRSPSLGQRYDTFCSMRCCKT